VFIRTTNRKCSSIGLEFLAEVVERPLIQEEERIQEIAVKLDTVEVLYVLALRPANISNLGDRLKSTFGFEMDSSRITDVIEILHSSGLIRKFSNYLDESQALRSPQEAFSITPLGLSKLAEWIESLSEITLTMQLGLDQRIVPSHN